MTDACGACRGTWPRADHFITDLGLSKVYLHDDQFFPGWTIVVFQRHATELFQLAPTERFQLIEEVNRVAKNLADVYHTKKMNYELTGGLPGRESFRETWSDYLAKKLRQSSGVT